MIVNYIIDHTPLWAWLTGGGIAVAVLLYLFSPILVPLWQALPQPVKIAIGFVVSIVLALLAGRHKGRQNAEAEERARNARAAQTRREVDADVNKLKEGDAAKTLRDRWSRD
jgi:hypothetical protein